MKDSTRYSESGPDHKGAAVSGHSVMKSNKGKRWNDPSTGRINGPNVPHDSRSTGPTKGRTR